MIYLYLKTHNQTGLKYLGKTESGDPYKYQGSGLHWKRHLKKHGDDVTTEILFQTEDREEFKRVAMEYSEKWNIVESTDFANLMPECGDGGDTVSRKIWITDGTSDKYWDKSNPIPLGWSRGRSNCVFNDRNAQLEFGSRADYKARGCSIKKAWDAGKMSHRKSNPLYGDDNPSRRPEVKEKIRKAALKESTIRSERMKKNKVWEQSPTWKKDQSEHN